MTTAQDQQSRADFEDWWKEFSWCGLDGGGGYEKTSAYAAWKVQADRAAAQVQAMGRVPPDAEAAWDTFAEAVRVKVGVKELVNIMGSVESLRAIFLAAAPPPSAAQEPYWDGLARNIMMWLDCYEGSKKTPRNLFKHLENVGTDVPQWLCDEPEMKALDSVPSKGTRCVILYRAMTTHPTGD